MKKTKKTRLVQVPKKTIKRAVAIAGSQKELGNLLSISQQRVCYYLTEGRMPPPLIDKVETFIKNNSTEISLCGKSQNQLENEQHTNGAPVL